MNGFLGGLAGQYPSSLADEINRRIFEENAQLLYGSQMSGAQVAGAQQKVAQPDGADPVLLLLLEPRA